MSHLSTHILDATSGGPAVDVEVELRDADGAVIASGRTDDDGRLALGPDTLPDGDYTVAFATGAYFARHEVARTGSCASSATPRGMRSPI